MKKFMPFIAAALFAASLFVSCANQSSDDSATNPSLASVLNSSSTSTVDLEGKSYTENVVLDKALTVKNATINGTVTVNVAGVTLENVSATKVIAGTGIGSGDFTLTNCSEIGSVEVNGGGSNSIHLNSCNIVLITVSKENVRIVPAGSMVIGSMAVSADNVMLDTSSSDVTVTTLTISADVKTILIMAAKEAANLFAAIAPKIIPLVPEEAELAKLMTNAWRYLEFAIANQFYMMVESKGLDFYKILSAMKTDYPRAAHFARAGLAAGPCLFKDTMQLSAFHSNEFFLGHSAMLVNEGLPNFLVNQLEEKMGSLKGKRIGILGMTFKADNDDTRESLAFKVRKLLELKMAKILISDPYVK